MHMQVFGNTMILTLSRVLLILSVLSACLPSCLAQGYGGPDDCAQVPMRPTDCEWLRPVPDGERLQTPEDTTAPKNVVLFTDGTNFDDAVTLLYLSKSPRSRLRAIYLQGNACAIASMF